MPIEPDRAAGRVRLGELPEWMPAAPTRACLTAHEHEPDFKWQTNFQVRGDLVREDDGWSLVPHKFVGGFELPEVASSQTYRENFRKMLRYRKKAKAELAKRRARRPRSSRTPLSDRLLRQQHAESFWSVGVPRSQCTCLTSVYSLRP